MSARHSASARFYPAGQFPARLTRNQLCFRPRPLRVQLAKKKAGSGKPDAKKAVPLPRGAVRAAYPGTCSACFKD
ncbi:hypothetical protein GCM10010394_55380 [Streptomyces crystallinus]|uniref:Uncharacterized protein n=1 Tax=Streptomyces crystallinus TaxID=68191 RepID=A0ABN1GS86_9ACTN